MESKEPSLLREIGKVAWLFAKVSGGLLALFAVTIPIFRRSVLAGEIVLYSVVLGGFIVFLGNSNYQSKKIDAEWKREAEEDRLKWEEAKKRILPERTA